MSPKGNQQSAHVKWEGEEMVCVASVLYLWKFEGVSLIIRLSYICTVIYKCERTFINMVLFYHLQPLQYKEAYGITLEIQNLKLGESPCLIQDYRESWCKKTKVHIF